MRAFSRVGPFEWEIGSAGYFRRHPLLEPIVNSMHSLERTRESEDADDEQRIELAMAILLLSRNYDPTPRKYARTILTSAATTMRTVVPNQPLPK